MKRSERLTRFNCRVAKLVHTVLRQGVLDCYVFDSLAVVRAITKNWLDHYNFHRPHESPGRIRPASYPVTKIPLISTFDWIGKSRRLHLGSNAAVKKANTKLSYKLAGFDHHMTKPASPWELETLLLKLPTAAKSVVCRFRFLATEAI